MRRLMAQAPRTGLVGAERGPHLGSPRAPCGLAGSFMCTHNPPASVFLQSQILMANVGTRGALRLEWR